MPNSCVLRVCVDVLEGNPTGPSLRASGPLPEVAGLLGDTMGSGRPRPRRAPLLTWGVSNTGSRDTQVCWAERRKPGQSKQKMLSLTVPRVQVIQLAESWHVLTLHPAIPGQEGKSKWRDRNRKW